MKFIKLTPVSIIFNGLHNKEMKEQEPIYVNMDKIRYFGKSQGEFITGYLCYEPREFLAVKETPEEIMKMIKEEKCQKTN